MNANAKMIVNLRKMEILNILPPNQNSRTKQNGDNR